MSYTGDQVDDLYEEFKKGANRQISNKASPVKLRAAESDLLRIAEKIRDLLTLAVKGDRDLLVEVFGGNCKRFHGYRQVMESVELSEMHKNDQRWRHVKEVMGAIEKILEDLGSFRPWLPPKKVPPEIKGYRGWKQRFAPGERVSMRPECEGSEAESYSLEGKLPQGLGFNSRTGEFTGTLKPGTEVAEQNYVVVAKNKHGETRTELNWRVGHAQPTGVNYAGVPDVCFTGEPVQWVPDLEGGVPNNWSVVPALPDGLKLDPQTGVIEGVPGEAKAAVEFTIKANNESGEASTTIKFEVKLAPPEKLTYPGAKDEYPFGSVVYLAPEITWKTSKDFDFAPRPRNPTKAKWAKLRKEYLTPETRWKSLVNAARVQQPKTSFTITPALPDGMVLAAKTGVISGQPTAPSDKTTFTVTCSTDTGSVSTELDFAVKLEKPSELEYPTADQRYYVGQPMALSPEVNGNVTEWSVTPALPAGLHLDPTLGIISGIPTNPTPQATYTVVAKNSEGEASGDITFDVVRKPPSGLSYPDAPEDFGTHSQVSLKPRVERTVDKFMVEPALPDGLNIDPATGVISGLPTKVVEKTTYTVTASNETGSTETPLAFGVKLLPPEGLSYPAADDVYEVGEKICLEPEIHGGATDWVVEPALPEGLTIDPATGKIEGAAVKEMDEASYVVTATNEAGGTSSVLTFAVLAPKPEGLSYPNLVDQYAMDQEVALEPELVAGVSASTTFSIMPALPDGLKLDPTTGVISGVPTKPADPTTYKVVASNKKGSSSADLTFAITEEQSASGIDMKFAASIEEITDVNDLMEEPGRTHNLGDWMIWMVHRAWLNDPSLVDFNFSNKWMPAPHVEPRIAPKLMKALAHNTHITNLQLSNSNMLKPQGHELAESLKTNTSLVIVNIESNSLDSAGLQSMAVALKENKGCSIAQLRFNNQRNLGQHFGRPVEEAIADLMEKNYTIVKIGFACQDAHWRLAIDRAILRNNDLARRRRKGSFMQPAVEEVVAQEKSLTKFVLSSPPDKAVWEVFDPEDERSAILQGHIAESKRLPTKEQLQSIARSKGKPIPYSAVATVFKDFRVHLVNAGLSGKIAAHDAHLVEYVGNLRAWTEKNDRWTLDVWTDDNLRYNFSSDKQPIIEVSTDFAAWLKPAS